jgi:nucleoside-diphosphate-sugar epimerase
MPAKKTVITGAAGLVGQNLLPLLKRDSLDQIVALDKHPTNTATLRRLHPEIHIVEADLAEKVRGRMNSRAALILSLATPKSVVSTHKNSFVIISRPPNSFWKLLFAIGFRMLLTSRPLS